MLPFLIHCSAPGTAQVLGVSREAAADFLKKGDTGFIRGPHLPADFSGARSRLGELSLVHPAAPFYAGLLAGADRKLSLLLFCAALESPSPSARREAALKLIPMILESADFAPAEAAPLERGQKRGEGYPGGGEVRSILKFAEDKSIEKPEAHLFSLRLACLYRLGRFEEVTALFSKDSGGGEAFRFQAESAEFSAKTAEFSVKTPWDRPLFLFAARRADPDFSRAGENAGALRSGDADFLFGAPPGGSSGGASLRWARREALSLPGFLSPEEASALSAKFFPGDYGAMYTELRPALEGGGAVFFRYPGLIPDIGRAYQYTPETREEGAELFAAWDRITARGKAAAEDVEYGGLAAFMNTLDAEELKKRRYPVLYYAGRIERARENYDASSEYFARALESAPDASASDSCIWYMLENALAHDPAAAVSLARETMPRWKDMPYFDDVLDRLSAYLVAGREWESLLEIFSGLEKRRENSRAGGVSLVQYAWILGRAAEEGYFTAEKDAESFFKIALAEKGSLHYRALAASKLGLSFSPEDSAGGEYGPEEEDSLSGKEREETLDFLLGFYECGAASFALPFIRAREDELSTADLRKIAETLAREARWKECLDLVSRYMKRETYEPERGDLSLFYPRPYRELIEKYAAEAELGPELLYGLVHTESFFQAAVISRSGAIGLSQLMPSTARDMAGRIARQGGPDYRGEGESGPGLTDPGVNIHIGSYYLRYLVEQMGSPVTALLAYNGGMGRIRRWLAGDRERGALPPDLFPESAGITETREYGRRVLSAALVYGWLYYGKTAEETAAEIYR